MGVGALLILLFIFDIGLIILIYTYNPQGVINRFLSLLMIPITLTNLEMLLLSTAGERLPVQIGFNIAVWGITFFFPLFYHFSFYFPRKEKKQKSLPVLILLYSVPIFFGIMHLLNLDPQKALIRFDEILTKTEFFKANLMFYLTQLFVFAYVTVLFILTTRRLLLSMKKPILEREKKNTIMVLAGFLPLSLILLTITVTYMPFRGGMIVYLITSGVYTVYFILLIIQFGFFEGKTFVRTFIIYPMYIALMVILYLFVFKTWNTRMAGLFNVSNAFLLALEIILFFIVVSPLVRFIERKLGDYVIPISSSLHEGIKSVQARLTQILDLYQLSSLLEEIFVQELKLKQFFFMLEDPSTNCYQNMKKNLEKESFQFHSDGELVKKLKKERRILNIQQIVLSWGGGTELEILDRYKITLILPLFTGRRLIGMCLLGELGVTRTWHFPEIEELELLGAGLSVVIERCRTHDSAIAIEKKQARIEKFAVLHEITSGVAHEIRNPMSVISTSAETIATKELGREETKKLAGYIQEETGRVSRLLNKILSIGPQTRRVSPFSADVTQVLHHTFELTASQAQKKDVQLKTSIKTKKTAALIDKEALTQVCLNIILNALEATPRGGYIIASVTSHDEHTMEIEIANSGEPITEEIRNKIFDPFITTRESGTGLGLPVSLRLVKEAGGSLSLLEDREGETVFQILLPVS